MKKRRIMAFLLACMILVSGCSAKADKQESGEAVDSTEMGDVAEEVIMEAEQASYTFEETSIPERITYPGESYTWEEVSIIIPQAWADKYVVKEDADGVSFYQKSSNEKDESMGFLCGIYRSDEYMNYGVGETLVAYTDDGMLYYSWEPTDVTCYVEDETIMAEYDEMMAQVDWIAGSMTIAGAGVHYDTSQYEIPVSSIVVLEEQHLVNLTDNELWIARNEIYARHGKVFQNTYLASYFNSCSWYEAKEGKTDVSERELNEVELANLKLIVAAEETYAKEHPYPKQYVVGETIEAALQTDGEKLNICYNVVIGEDRYHACVLTIDGIAYDLNDYVTMTNPVEDVFYITDIAYYDEKLEIAILDEGPSADPVTYFFQYDGNLRYVGEVQGFPFENYANNPFNGFNGLNSVIGVIQRELIESAYVYAYYWYNSVEGTLELMERTSMDYTWFDAHELYVDLPVYYSRDEASPTLTMQAQEEVFFISTDCKEWILVRSKDGVEGYIHIEDGQILNIGLPAEEVFSDLYFFG